MPTSVQLMWGAAVAVACAGVYHFLRRRAASQEPNLPAERLQQILEAMTNAQQQQRAEEAKEREEARQRGTASGSAAAPDAEGAGADASAKPATLRLCPLCAADFRGVNARDESGRTALFVASRDGHLGCVDSLLAHGADARKCRLSDKATPLYMAAQNGRTDCVDALLTRGNAEVAFQDADGATALYIAAQQGHAAVVARLCREPNAPVNVGDASGVPPVFVAAMEGHLECVRAMHRAGADVTSAVRGGTPLMMAERFGKSAVVEYLRSVSSP